MCLDRWFMMPSGEPVENQEALVIAAENFKLRNIDSPANCRPKLTTTGKVLLAACGTTFGLVCAATIPFVIPAARKVCLPYVPATTHQVENVLSLLRGQRGQLIDLGSGDGRIVIEAARRGFNAEGVELNPWLVWYSRYKSFREGTSRNTSFVTRNLWKTDLHPYRHVVIFGVESMMSDLEVKLKQELKPEAQIIACRFPLPNLVPEDTVGAGIDTVWLYKTGHKSPKPAE